MHGKNVLAIVFYYLEASLIYYTRTVTVGSAVCAHNIQKGCFEKFCLLSENTMVYFFTSKFSKLLILDNPFPEF